MHAVILAGGRGTRLAPLTDTRPKPLLPFMGEPFAVGLLRRLAAAGCDRATFLVGADAAPWQGLAVDGVSVAVVTEETPLDTAGAVRRLLGAGAGRSAGAGAGAGRSAGAGAGAGRSAGGGAGAGAGAGSDGPEDGRMGGPEDGRMGGPVDGPVLVCNGDILTDLDVGALLAAHEHAGAAATLALTRVADTASFGVVVCDAAGRVQRFVEKPAPGTVDADTVNAGTYVLAPDVFAGFPGDGPLSFERAVFPGLLDAGATLLGVVSPAHWQDLGTPERYLAGHRAVLEGRCAWPLADGLRVAATAGVHASAVVHPTADLGAGTVVGAGCVIDAGARLAETVLHPGAHVGAEAQVRRAIVGPGARVGATAVVGPDVVLADGQAVAAGARVHGRAGVPA